MSKIRGLEIVEGLECEEGNVNAIRKNCFNIVRIILPFASADIVNDRVCVYESQLWDGNVVPPGRILIGEVKDHIDQAGRCLQEVENL